MPLLREVANRSIDLLALQAREQVLEVGCGSGVFLPLLAEAVGESGRVVGLDHAPAFVEQARANELTKPNGSKSTRVTRMRCHTRAIRSMPHTAIGF
jgi:protein-L-isoaspartate O-methyltransferase